MVQRRARVCGSLLQFRGQSSDSETRDGVSSSEWHGCQQPRSSAHESRQSILHGQDVHQVRQGVQEAVEL